MGQIQRLTRGLIKPYNSVPRIDWSHPLAAGLATYCYDAGNTIVDLVNGTHQFKKFTSVGQSTYPGGTGLKFGLTDFGAMPPFPSGLINPFGGAAPYSAVLGTYFTGLVGPSSPDSAGVTVQDAANSEDTFFGFNTWPPGDPTTPNAVSCVFGNITNAFFNNAVISPGKFQSWGVTVPTSTTAKLYYNGTVDNQSFSGTTIFNADTQAQVMYNTASINAGQTFGNGLNGFIPYFAMWGRALTQSDYLQLYEDPYCFLIYPEDEVQASLVGVINLDILMAQICL